MENEKDRDSLEATEISEATLAIANMRETLEGLESVIESEGNCNFEETQYQLNRIRDAMEHFETLGTKLFIREQKVIEKFEKETESGY